MKWYVFEKVANLNDNHVVVQAKNLASANKRLTNWGVERKVEVSMSTMNGGIGFDTMTEAWAKFGHITLVPADN